eukprot:1734119-Prymnesium_polylepis.2
MHSTGRAKRWALGRPGYFIATNGASLFVDEIMLGSWSVLTRQYKTSRDRAIIARTAAIRGAPRSSSRRIRGACRA